MLCLLSLFLAGCETGEVSSGESAGGQGAESASTKPSSYAQAVEISWEKVESLEELGISAQSTDLGLVQYVNDSRVRIPLLFEQGEATALTAGGNWYHTGVMATSAVGVLFPQGSTLTYTWTFPQSEGQGPTLVSFRFQSGGMTLSLPASQNTVVVHHEFHGWYHNIYVNGELLRSEVHSAHFFIPSFVSSSSGPHTLQVSAVGSSAPASGTWHYNQKALRFKGEFPDYDLESLQPIQITHEFEWDNGAPVESPTWQVVVDDRFVKTGSDTNISATWGPG